MKLIFIFVFITSLQFLSSQSNAKITSCNDNEIRLNTAKYYETRSRVSRLSLRSDKQILKNYNIVFVSGFMTNTFPQIMEHFRTIGLPISQKMFVTFNDQMELLNSLGINFDKPLIHTQRRPDYNLEIIKKSITDSNKQSIIVSFSKGGIDTLNLLIKSEDVRNKVAGWISIQTPFKGSPLVDLIQSRRVINSVANLFLKLFDGNGQALESMNSLSLKFFKEDYRNEINEIIKTIPIISVGSYEEVKLFSFKKSLLSPFILLMNRLANGGKSDGFIPVSSTCLKGTQCITLKGMDHAAPVFDIPFFKSYGTKKRISFTRTLFHSRVVAF
jgi:hypothetical protein